ncbi:hypothetical protein FJZ33_01595 [Candidatus Poribacteria bacterium]|nr:hypothetical protein [Candidatus Poribacteria bacterium]
MKTEEIIGHPLYQLNLILWLLQPLKDNYPLRPILNELGYELFAIGPTMSLSPELRDRIASTSVQCDSESEPDLMLSKDGVKEFVIIECKKQLFGSESNTAKQARALLLQTGEQFNISIALPVGANPDIHLIYVSKHSSSKLYTGNLCEISEELKKIGFDVLPVGSIGIESKSNSIFLCDAYGEGKIPDQMRKGIGKKIKVQVFEEDEDPIPLFYIPWDPNVSQSDEISAYCEQVFRERILSNLIIRIGKATPPRTIEINYDELLNESTSSFYERWRSKNIGRTLRNCCRDLINNALKGAQENFDKEKLPQPLRGVSLKIKSDEDKEAVIDSITKLRVDKWLKEEDSQMNFPIIDDDI